MENKLPLAVKLLQLTCLLQDAESKIVSRTDEGSPDLCYIHIMTEVIKVLKMK